MLTTITYNDLTKNYYRVVQCTLINWILKKLFNNTNNQIAVFILLKLLALIYYI